MPIVSSDILLRLSGGSSNTSPAAALGGAMSTVSGGIITSAAANNLWDDVTAPEASAGDTEYRCVYVHNNHGSLTLQNAVLWVDTSSSGTTSPDTSIDVALDSAAVGSTAASTSANESTAPTGGTAPTFAGTAVSKGTALSIGDIAAGSKKAFWVKRVVTAGAAAYSDVASFRVEGDTAP